MSRKSKRKKRGRRNKRHFQNHSRGFARRFRNDVSGVLIAPGATVGIYDICSGGVYKYPNAMKIWLGPSTLGSGRYCWDQTNYGPPYKTGGNFNSFQFFTDYALKPKEAVVLHSASEGALGDQRYRGHFYIQTAPYQYDLIFSDANLIKESQGKGSPISHYGAVDQYGAQAYNQFKPGKPSASMGVFLAEAKDIPQMLQGTANFFQDIWKMMGGGWGFSPKHLADHWLNTQFGWLPFLSDLRQFTKTMDNMTAQLDSIKRHNATWMKRGGVILELEDTAKIYESLTQPRVQPLLNSQFYTNDQVPGQCSVYRTLHQKVWFSAFFKYFIDDIDTSIWWKYRIGMKRLGLWPSPLQVWKATPWGWLIDWYCPLMTQLYGSVDSGWAENLVSHNAYIMGTTRYRYTQVSELRFKSGSLMLEWQSIVQWKHRYAASPFGFNLASSDFTARQLSILLALGIDRAS